MLRPRTAALQLLAMLACLVAWAAPGATNSPEESIILPQGFADPIEPFNRAIWEFDKGFMTWVVRPASTGYRFVVPKPVRVGFAGIGTNLTYPDRLLNNMLEGKWLAMGEETERCLCNTALGLGGFWDLATLSGIPKHDADFNQTFQQWGWQPDFFLMLPIYGPSDDRATVGLVGDTLANPMTYFFPYQYISGGVTFNDFTDTVEESVRFSRSEWDSYAFLQYVWSFAHGNQVADMQMVGKQDQATLETLHSFYFSFKDPAFPARGKTRSVFIPSTGKKLDFTFWLQPGHAPVVYIVPGFGAHRLTANALGLAELVFEHGFSAVSISSTFHPEFMEHASTTDLPSYPPTDVADVHAALTEIDHHLDKVYPNRLGSRALLGYSMGGFQSLFMAAQTPAKDASLVKFDRYVAIDSPVNLHYSVTNLDHFYEGPLAWPAAERTRDIKNTLLKLADLTLHPQKPGAVPPFNDIESKFLVGLGLRLSLRDVIFSSQLRHNQGVLQQPLKKFSRRAAYEEIMQYSFADYVLKFATPYDEAKGIDLSDPDAVKKATDLRFYTAGLKANPEVRVIANRNDPLLAAEDVAWIETSLPAAQVKLFDHGGHLGNLLAPAMQEAILGALEGLGAVQKK